MRHDEELGQPLLQPEENSFELLTRQLTDLSTQLSAILPSHLDFAVPTSKKPISMRSISFGSIAFSIFAVTGLFYRLIEGFANVFDILEVFQKDFQFTEKTQSDIALYYSLFAVTAIFIAFELSQTAEETNVDFPEITPSFHSHITHIKTMEIVNQHTINALLVDSYHFSQLSRQTLLDELVTVNRKTLHHLEDYLEKDQCYSKTYYATVYIWAILATPNFFGEGLMTFYAFLSTKALIDIDPTSDLGMFFCVSAGLSTLATFFYIERLAMDHFITRLFGHLTVQQREELSTLLNSAQKQTDTLQLAYNFISSPRSDHRNRFFSREKETTRTPSPTPLLTSNSESSNSSPKDGIHQETLLEGLDSNSITTPTSLVA